MPKTLSQTGRPKLVKRVFLRGGRRNTAFTAFNMFKMAGFKKCCTILKKISFLGHEGLHTQYSIQSGNGMYGSII
jgi:hypothetical protein